MSSESKTFLAREECFAIERNAEVRSEYYNGADVRPGCWKSVSWQNRSQPLPRNQFAIEIATFSVREYIRMAQDKTNIEQWTRREEHRHLLSESDDLNQFIHVAGID